MKRMNMVGDAHLIGARHEFEEEGRLNMSKPVYKVGEAVEATIIGTITEVVKTEDNVFYRLVDKETGAYGMFKECQIMELITPEDIHEPMEQKIESEER